MRRKICEAAREEKRRRKCVAREREREREVRQHAHVECRVSWQRFSVSPPRARPRGGGQGAKEQGVQGVWRGTCVPNVRSSLALTALSIVFGHRGQCTHNWLWPLTNMRRPATPRAFQGEQPLPLYLCWVTCYLFAFNWQAERN